MALRSDSERYPIENLRVLQASWFGIPGQMLKCRALPKGILTLRDYCSGARWNSVMPALNGKNRNLRHKGLHSPPYRPLVKKT